HQMISDSDGPPNEVKLARLMSELMFMTTWDAGINPAFPYEEKTTLAAQSFGPEQAYQPPVPTVTENQELLNESEAPPANRLPRVNPLEESEKQTIFVPNFPNSPEWVRQPLMDALRRGSPHVTVFFENLSDPDLELFKKVASGKISPY